MIAFLIIISILLMTATSIGINSYNNLSPNLQTQDLTTRCNFLIWILTFSILMFIICILAFVKGWNKGLDKFFENHSKIGLALSEFFIIFLLAVSSVSFTICEKYFESNSTVYVINALIIAFTTIALISNIGWFIYKNKKEKANLNEINSNRKKKEKEKYNSLKEEQMKKREEFEKSIKEERSKKSVEIKKQKEERENLFQGRKK